jgi:hypothetical protein
MKEGTAQGQCTLAQDVAVAGAWLFDVRGSCDSQEHL